MLTRIYSSANLIAIAFVAVFSYSASATPIAINSPTSFWNAVYTQSGNQMDYPVDQQTGQTEADITGNAQNAGFYRYFDNNGSASHTDGTLYFRIRLGRDQSPAGFNSGLFVGINIPSVDNSLKIFLGVDNRGGGGNAIKIFDAGTGANTSPSTTSIAAPTSQKVYAETGTNYDWHIVNSTYDPIVTNLDTNGDGSTDFFLSFSLPFGDVVSELIRLRGVTISDATLIRYVVVTSTQDNSFNQDLGGVNGGVNSTLTWDQLGAYTPPVTTEPVIIVQTVPEPASIILTGLGISVLAWKRRRRQN